MIHSHTKLTPKLASFEHLFCRAHGAQQMSFPTDLTGQLPFQAAVQIEPHTPFASGRLEPYQ
jgi:hypothetical protein